MRRYFTHKPLCLPYSFAMCLDIDPMDLLGKLDHDPMEQVRPEANGCNKFRSSHIDELIDVCFEMGYRVAPIEFDPWLGTTTHMIQVHPEEETQMSRLQNYTRGKNSVLIGAVNRDPNRRHAVATDGIYIYDPRPKIEPYRLENILSTDFYPMQAWTLINDV